MDSGLKKLPFNIIQVLLTTVYPGRFPTGVDFAPPREHLTTSGDIFVWEGSGYWHLVGREAREATDQHIEQYPQQRIICANSAEVEN